MLVHLVVDVVMEVKGEALPEDVKQWVEDGVFGECGEHQITDYEGDPIGSAEVLTAVAIIQRGA